jgi:hypothetical protein
MSRSFTLLLVIVVIVILNMTFEKMLLINSYNRHDTFRRILQINVDPTESSLKNSSLNSLTVSLVKENNGNIPDYYFSDKNKKTSSFNNTCAKFPDLLDLRFKNDLWQVQKTSNGTLLLFNAYWDERNGTKIRIVGMYDVHPTDAFFCQFWYPNSDKPVFVLSEPPFWMFYPKWGADNGYFIHPYLISCKAEMINGQLPTSVSLVERECDNASNNLKILRSQGEKNKNFVVCVKGLSFPYEDKTTRLAEWIEYLNILGAEKINFYEFKVHPNTKKLLEYYEEKGLIEVTPLSLVGDYSNQPYLQDQFLHKKIIQRRLQEVIPYNDCLYKHLQEFKYVVLLDTDEVIVPAEGTWVELIATLNNILGKKSSYVARNVYFLDSHLHEHSWFEGIPKYMHMLQHVYRAKNYTKPGHYIKGFHDTDLVTALHNHFPYSCLGGCKHKEIDLELAHLQHYRADCVKGVNCDAMKVNRVMDTRVWNFKDELIQRVERVLAALEFAADSL